MQAVSARSIRSSWEQHCCTSYAHRTALPSRIDRYTSSAETLSAAGEMFNNICRDSGVDRHCSGCKTSRQTHGLSSNWQCKHVLKALDMEKSSLMCCRAPLAQRSRWCCCKSLVESGEILAASCMVALAVVAPLQARFPSIKTSPQHI